jgi:hypothetical protein
LRRIDHALFGERLRKDEKMVRFFRHLTPTLFAVVAIGAAAATPASAGNIATDSYPSVLEAEAESTSVFTVSGITVECEEALAGAGLEGPVSSVTVTGGVAECIAGERLVTVEKSECEVSVGGLSGSGENWTGTGSLSCPTGKVLVAHIYNGPGYTNPWCTTTAGSQSGLPGATVTNKTNGGGSSDDTIAIEETVEEVATQVHGTCSLGFTLNVKGALHLSLSVKATTVAGTQIGARIE